MNQRQINYKEMYGTVLNLMENNIGIWSSVPIISQLENLFKQLYLKIEQSQEDQQKAQVHIGKNKTQLKQIIADKADVINDILEAYAGMVDNHELADMMGKSYSQLKEMRNADFTKEIALIIEKAEEHEDTITKDYGLNKDLIEDIKTDLNGFTDMEGKPRMYQVSSSVATQNLEELFNETNSLLKDKLDKAMKVFKRSKPDFYQKYLAARIIIDK